MKTSYEVQDSAELAAVKNSNPETAMETSDEALGYDIMDDIQTSQSNYITEYIIIPLCVLGGIALVVYLYLKFLKKQQEPENEENDVEKQNLPDNAEDSNNDEEKKEEVEAKETTEDVGKDDSKSNEDKNEEENKE